MLTSAGRGAVVPALTTTLTGSHLKSLSAHLLTTSTCRRPLTFH